MRAPGCLGDRQGELRKPSLTLAVVAGIIATASCGSPAEPTPADVLSRLERALPSRIVEARLSIRQPSEGCIPIPEEYTATCTFPESGSREYLRLAQATNDAHTFGRAGETAEHLHLEGLALLLWSSRQEGTVERAVARLEAAAELAPRDPAILSDLAAAHLEAGRRGGRFHHYVRALDAAVKALVHAPGHAPALFNRALAMERLGLPEEGLDGWGEYLELDAGSPWTGEVGERIGRIEVAISTPQIGTDEILAMVADGDLDGLLRIAQQDPQLARTVAMDRLLPAWGLAHRGGEVSRAEELLASLEVLADVLADQSVSVAAKEIRQALNTPDRPLASHLALGYIALGEGRTAYVRVDDTAALAHLSVALEHLESAGSPLASWASAWMAASNLAQTHYPEAAFHLEQSSRGSAPEYPALNGLQLRIAGLVAGRGGRLGAAAFHYREAIEEIERTDESLQLAGLWGLLAEVQKLLGNPLEAWNARVLALRSMAARGTDVQIHQVLYETASATRAEGRLNAAAYLQVGVRERAERTSVPEYVAEAMIRAGELQVQLGRLADAVHSADSARRAASGITNERVAGWIQADLARLDHSLLGQAGAPSPASLLTVLDSAIATQRGLGHQHLLLNLLVERGRTLALLGREEARTDIDAALALVGQVAASTLDSREQARFAESARSIGDIAAAMTAGGTVDASWGLGVLEELATVAWGSPSGPATSQDTGIPSVVPQDRAVIRYAVLERELLVWVLVGEERRIVNLAVPARELARLADALRRAGERALANADLSAPGRDLSDQILPPQVMEWVGTRDLVIVPDGPLVGIPFAILPGSDGEMLLRHRAVSVAPSVAWATSLVADALPGADGGQVVLAGHGLPTEGLPSLSGAREEVEALRGRYPGAVVLMDSAATPVTLREAIQRADLLHFAGHAVSAQTLTGGSYLVLSPDDPVDPESARYRPTGTAGEAPRTVILTACASVAPDGTLSGGGFWGIAQPLLRGGSRSIIGTLWPLPDHEAAAFSELLHQELSAGAEPGVALRAAQLRALDGETVPPRTWAAFQLVGAGV